MDNPAESQSVEVYKNLTKDENHIRYRIFLEKEVTDLQRKLEIADLEDKQSERQLELKIMEQALGHLYDQRNAMGLKVVGIEKKRRKALEQTKEGWKPTQCDGKCDLALYLFS